MPKVQPPELKKFMDKKLSGNDPACLPCWGILILHERVEIIIAFSFLCCCIWVVVLRKCASVIAGGQVCWRVLECRAYHMLLMLCNCAAVSLNANRQVTGVLRGFDQFMNIVLDNAVDEKNKTDIGMVVRAATQHMELTQCTLCAF